LNKDDLKPPAPWDAAAAESPELIGRFTVDARDVSAFSRSVVAGEDTPRFVSLVTGTGLPPGTGVYIPKETPRKPVDPKATRTTFWLAIATAALFAIASTWSLSVGSLSRAAYSFFQIPDKCPTSSIIPSFSGVLSNKRIKRTENLSEKNRNPPIDGEDRHCP
jgi:hypothetical protein